MLPKLRSRLTYGNVVATVALFVALGGSAAASVIISSNSQVGPNTISGHKPPQGDHANLVPGSVNNHDLATGAVTSPKLVPGAVTTPKLGTSSVTGAKVLNDSLTGADINESTLNGSQITGVDAHELAGRTASHYPNQFSTARSDMSGTGTGTTVGLFGGALSGIGSFSVHCQTGSNSFVRLVANNGQSDLGTDQVTRDSSPPIVASQAINDNPGQMIQLVDTSPTVVTWQIQDQNSTEIATLILGFQIGSPLPNDCSFTAQLLMTQT